MSQRTASKIAMLTAVLLLAAGCGNNRDFSRGEMKPYIVERGDARAEALDDAGSTAR